MFWCSSSGDEFILMNFSLLISIIKPHSSRTSRAHASSSVSSKSTYPPGTHHLPWLSAEPFPLFSIREYNVPFFSLKMNVITATERLTQYCLLLLKNFSLLYSIFKIFDYKGVLDIFFM